ncbi:MAG: hypothetical protein K8H86_04455 [Ignavibacteriaceae bacterium]|nr:hypothetical protein [Ignavibacteriaceae bacterium]
MKTIFLFFLFTITIFSQKYAPEFYICIEDGIGSFSFSLQKLKNSYCYDNNNNFYLCSACTTQNCDDCSTDVETVNSTTLGIHCDQKGWGFCAKGSDTKDPHYGYGVYKLKKIDSNHYIYIDTKDSRYGRQTNENYPDSYGSDFKVIYNVPNQIFWWDAQTDGTNDGPIEDGSVLQLWKGKWLVNENGQLVSKTFTSPDVTSFPSNYFQNSLAIGNDYFSISVEENSTLL